MFGTLAICLTALALGQVEGNAKKIPYRGDETPLVRVKANPEKYLGKTFVICGGLALRNYYNYSYENAENTFYSLSLHETGKDTASVGRSSERADLYLSKRIGAAIVDTLTKFEEENKSGKKKNLKLARVEVTLVPSKYAKDKEWNMMEVIDVQFVEKDYKGWQPWIIEKEREEEMSRRKAQRNAIEKQRVEEETKKQAAREAKIADKEGMASSHLQLAKGLMSANPKKAKERLTKIVQQYPETMAAKEAKELLRKLDE